MPSITEQSAESLDAFECLFAAIPSEFCSHDGWRELEGSTSDFHTLIKQDSPGTFFCRSKFELDVPLATALAIWRPEIALHSKHGELAPWCAGSGVDWVLAPGDVVGWYKFEAMPFTMKWAVCMRSPSFGKEPQLDDAYRMRVALRSEFPVAGQHSIIFAPLLCETSQITSEWGIRPEKYVFCAGESPDKTVVTALWRPSGVPAWALHGTLSELHGAFQRSAEASKGSKTLEDALSGPLSYVVVSLRSCSRGPPLLPAAGEDGPRKAMFRAPQDASSLGDVAWEPEQPASFDLPSYLRAFLGLLGVHTRVHDCIDGRQLKRFQAVMQRSDWDAAWAKMSGAWALQRTAYRRLRGGTAAPRLYCTVEPQFVRGTPPAFADLEASTSDAPVSRTFVHYGGSEPKRKGRSRSTGCSRALVL